MKTITLILTSCLLVLVSQAASLESSPTDSPKDKPRQFAEVFKKQDTNAMQKYFAAEVAFSGEHRFIGRKEPLKAPVALTRKELVESYSALFEKVGKERWPKLANTFKVAIERIKNEGDYGSVGKVGDLVLILKGSAKDLDEAIMFVFRETDAGFLIVGHFADY